MTLDEMKEHNTTRRPHTSRQKGGANAMTIEQAYIKYKHMNEWVEATRQLAMPSPHVNMLCDLWCAVRDDVTSRHQRGEDEHVHD